MVFTKNKILWWICIEILILITFAIGVVIRVANDDYSDVDIIVTFSVLGFCLVLLVLTVACYFRSLDKETLKDTSSVKINILDQGKLWMKMKPVHKDFASDCAICLLPKDSTSHTIVQISCKHDYHDKCIEKCFQKTGNVQCPECRQDAIDHQTIQPTPV
ncbi:uncharacterized protein LOC125683466 [Ostrea edulis]|uniref:uncharacterized protein LOC125683466 n=1 Tax=Ostrea edulis TaxID=37623 RepID=UPI002094991A|nr:uncharacterized protein LOC125683466 [Ostrea edulis]